MAVPDIIAPQRAGGNMASEQVLSRARELRLDKLLLPLDGSDEAELTLPYAAILSRHVGSELSLFHCLQPMHPVRVGRTGHIPYPDAQHDRGSHLATAYLDEVKSRLKPHGLHARWNVATGSAAHHIAYRAATGKYGMTLLSAKSRSRVVNTVQPNVLRELWKLTAGPLFLLNRSYVHLNGTAPLHPETMFVPLNESKTFQAAMPLATTLAAALKSRLILLLNPPDSKSKDEAAALGSFTPVRDSAEQLAEELRGQGCFVEIETVSGGVIGIARRQLQERGSWVIAGSHMRSGLAKVLRGSKGDNFLRQCRGPLIVVPNPSVAKARDKKIRKKMAAAESPVSLV